MELPLLSASFSLSLTSQQPHVIAEASLLHLLQLCGDQEAGCPPITGGSITVEKGDGGGRAWRGVHAAGGAGRWKEGGMSGIQREEDPACAC